MPERRGSKHLYSEESKREFEEEYGKSHGDAVWHKTLGRVAAEQAAHEPGGTKTERVEGHFEWRDGKRFHVRAHTANVHAHVHSHGHHGGRCGAACRAGRVPHRHRHGRRG